MIRFIIPLVSAFLHPELMETCLYPIFALCFLCVVPHLIRQFIDWR